MGQNGLLGGLEQNVSKSGPVKDRKMKMKISVKTLLGSILWFMKNISVQFLSNRVKIKI